VDAEHLAADVHLGAGEGLFQGLGGGGQLVALGVGERRDGALDPDAGQAAGAVVGDLAVEVLQVHRLDALDERQVGEPVEVILDGVLHLGILQRAAGGRGDQQGGGGVRGFGKGHLEHLQRDLRGRAGDVEGVVEFTTEADGQQAKQGEDAEPGGDHLPARSVTQATDPVQHRRHVRSPPGGRGPPRTIQECIRYTRVCKC